MWGKNIKTGMRKKRNENGKERGRKRKDEGENWNLKGKIKAKIMSEG
jgi:hypothetical protein